MGRLKGTHRLTHIPEYGIWTGMRNRCLNPNHGSYHQYGGRGITICDRWSNFENFLADMGPRPSASHSIDRYPDNDGPYCKENCRWATPREQSNNKRNNVKLTINGETMTLSQWSRKAGMAASVLWGRVQSGWDETRLLEPLKWLRPSSEFGHNWSGFRGVYKNRRKGKPFLAKVKAKGKEYHLGYFYDPSEASIAVETFLAERSNLKRRVR